MAYTVLVQGKFTVVAHSIVKPDTWELSSPVLEFLEEKAADKNYRSSCNGYPALFKRYSEGGPPAMTYDMFHDADKARGIYEFIKGSLRVFCFMDGNIVYLTNGCVKSGKKADPQAVAEASRVKDDYFREKGNSK